ncbi:zygote arrest protein 1-like [Ruditapes philippinarum]|uniref:zygote arrest protein 1-like n=1 Tax=Ruditapes philippinarum TaxID=129788 RepID=UPI00295C027F|nr:zygote arrest protein 1-like [Ruditapes philippinarum]
MEREQVQERRQNNREPEVRQRGRDNREQEEPEVQEIRRNNRRRRPPLERKFGFFQCHCSKESSWTSAHVYCVYGTNRVYFKQKCKACGEAKNPFRVRNLQCPDCGLDRDDCECECVYCEKHRYDCECEFDDEETGPEKPHRSDLCMKCLAGLPCQRGDDTDRPSRRRRRRRGRRRD